MRLNKFESRNDFLVNEIDCLILLGDTELLELKILLNPKVRFI